eukprot:SAG11_NODE_24470_length_373_cov_0.419708_1_plen_77_part_10
MDEGRCAPALPARVWNQCGIHTRYQGPACAQLDPRGERGWVGLDGWMEVDVQRMTGARVCILIHTCHTAWSFSGTSD